jgi:hypothetical protein
MDEIDGGVLLLPRRLRRKYGGWEGNVERRRVEAS